MTKTKTGRALAALAASAVLAGGMTVASVAPAEAVSGSGSATGKYKINLACKDFRVAFVC